MRRIREAFSNTMNSMNVRRAHNSFGFAIPMVLAILIISSITFYTTTQLFGVMDRSQQRVKNSIAVEDLRNFVRQALNCEKTVESNEKFPLAPGPTGIIAIRLLDPNGNVFVYPGGSVFGSYKIRASSTTVAPSQYLLEVRRLPINLSRPWNPLFREPLGCSS